MKLIRQTVNSSIYACLLGLSLAGHAASFNYNYTDTTTLITMNDGTQTEWLHLDQTRNKSYNLVSANLGTGGTYEGWNYASMSLVSDVTEELFGLNWETEETGWNTAYDGIAVQIIGVFGSTKSSDYYTTYEIVQGLVSNYVGSSNLALTLKANDSTADQYLGMDNIDRPIVRADGTAGAQIGSFLYRPVTVAAVPIPSAVWLFGSGLLGLMRFSRRHK